MRIQNIYCINVLLCECAFDCVIHLYCFSIGRENPLYIHLSALNVEIHTTENIKWWSKNVSNFLFSSFFWMRHLFTETILCDRSKYGEDEENSDNFRQCMERKRQAKESMSECKA